MRVIFVRHGETEWNKLTRFQGSSDIELSEVGFEQARLVGERFKRLKLSDIYSSPLKRAYATALVIKGERNIEVHKDKRFKEIDYGYWEGMYFNDVSIKYSKEYISYIRKPHECVFPGEGSHDKARKRASEALGEIIQKYENTEDNIAIVAHGGIIRLMIFELLNISTEFYHRFPLYNTAISVVEVTAEGNRLISFNDISHLGFGIETYQNYNLKTIC